MRHLRRIKSNKGAAVVEFALVAMLLFLVIIAMSEFSRAWMLMGVANGAARAGARYAAIIPNVAGNEESVDAKVRAVLDDAHIPAEDVEVDIVVGETPSVGDPVTVNVTVAFHTSFAHLFPRLDELPLRASCSMLREI
jgi:Flp pilus assembly protein TadG